MSIYHIKIKIAVVAVFATSIFVGTNAIISTTANAQGIIGTSCSELEIKKKSCSGNTLVTIKCSPPTDCNGEGLDTCNSAKYECFDGCRQREDSCYSCPPDLNLGGHLQRTYADKIYTACKDACQLKISNCLSTCGDTWRSCDQAVRDKNRECEARFHWEEYSEQRCDSFSKICVQNGDSATCVLPSVPPAKALTPPVENAPGPSPYAACAIKCLDDVDARYPCSLPSPSIDDSGVSVIVLPDGSTRNFSLRDNECVDDRGKTQHTCLSHCPAPIGGELMSDPMSEGQKIKVAGVASDDPLNEAEKYIDFLRRRPDFPSREENIKTILGDYKAGKPMSVWDVKGEPEMQVPGSDEWVVLKKDDIIPSGARIFTGMDDDLFVRLPGVYLVKVRSFTDITFNQTGIPEAFSKGELIDHLDLRTGDVEVHVERGTYQGSMQVRMPQAVAGVRGTHFWVLYDEAKRLGTVGVYEGEVAVDDLLRGTRTLLTPVNDKTSRVIVIPSMDLAPVQDQDIGAANSRSQPQERSNSDAWWLISALVIGAGVFILHKMGMLKPILRKILALVQRDTPKPL